MFDTENWIFHYDLQISPISRGDQIFQQEKKMSILSLY